ncbi:MAG: endonuclease III domain-containing protein [Deltaproteobacteria bacterium]|nr:endonuclease III domain-containing protein [Deltaproteobacteria bacterium]
MAQVRKNLKEIYQLSLQHFGLQHWWPGDSPFEVMVGAILTQNTAWTNVEKAIQNLKAKNLLSLQALLDLPDSQLAETIRPAGYFNVKTQRLKEFLKFLQINYQGDIQKMVAQPTKKLRQELLSVKGIGQETADSILLYALEHPIFVVDAYTYRIFTRHGLVGPEAQYEDLQEVVMDVLEPEVKFYKEFHAQIVMIGKNFCKPTARCEQCPLNSLPHWV